MEKALHDLSIAEAGAMLRSGQVTSLTLTEHALDRIDQIDPLLSSFVLVTRERALADAVAADAAFAKGLDAGPMQGIPHALKDIYATAGIRTTCHSKLLIDHVPSSDCAVAEKFAAQGAVLLGKLGTHEFALGGPSFDLPFPPPRNPWNRDRIPGGSSSGSAAAVAAGLVRMAMGSDTGGSIRGPAGYCGTVGLKPTYGLVSRRGVFPLAYSLDHCGPLGWTVEDCAIAMEVIAGFDPRDPASADHPVPNFRGKLDHGVHGLRLAIPRHWFATADGISAETLRAIDAAAQSLAKLGASIDEIKLPDLELFNACGRLIMISEAYAIHETDFQARPLDFALYTYLRMIPGAFVSATDLTQAMRLRRQLSVAVNTALVDYDGMITASTLTPAPAFTDLDPLIAPSLLIQAMAFDVTGNPAMSIPTGLSSEGLPLSMQIAGRAFDEPTVLQIGAALEATIGLNQRRPEINLAPHGAKTR